MEDQPADASRRCAEIRSVPGRRSANAMIPVPARLTAAATRNNAGIDEAPAIAPPPNEPMIVASPEEAANRREPRESREQPLRRSLQTRRRMSREHRDPADEDAREADTLEGRDQDERDRVDHHRRQEAAQ